MKSMRRTLTTLGLIGLLVATIVGCDLFRSTDLIVGEWQLVSVNGIAPVLVSEVRFTEDTYTASTGGIETHSGTWTRSGRTYTLTGTFFGFASSGSFTPTFSNSNNTLTYSNESGDLYVYNRQ